MKVATENNHGNQSENNHENQSKEIIKFSKKSLQVIEAIYLNPCINLTQLSKTIGSTTSNTSIFIGRILKIEPPLVEKRKSGKYVFYSLTEQGKKFFEAISPSKIKQEEPIMEVQSMSDLEKYLMSYILCSVKENSNPLVTSLIEMDIGLFSKRFTFREFIFLAIQVGILSENSINKENVHLFSNIKDWLLDENERMACLQKFFDFINTSYSNGKFGIEKTL